MSAECFEPTVRPYQPFYPLEDAKLLRAAMKGFGTDEAAIIDVLTRRSNSQRQEIISAFKHEFGRDLVKDLKSELGGKFEKLILALMDTPNNYLAREIYIATVAKLGTDEDCLTEILCTRTNNEIRLITEAFMILYGKSLEDVVTSETSGDYKRLLIMLLMLTREEGRAYPERAREMAESLYNAGEGKLGTDEEAFTTLLAHQSFVQLRFVFDEYRKLSGKTLEQAVKSEFSGDLQNAILTMIQCAENRSRFYAEKLEKAMKGIGCDDGILIRIIVSRCEIDLEAIKREYQNIYRKTLYNAVKSETSGDYKAAMLALIGPA